MSPWPGEECWCPSRLCHRVHAVLMAVLGWQGHECLTMAEGELYSRYLVPHQIPKLRKFATTSVPEHTWGQPMVQKANLPLAGHPFSLLWIETSTAPLAPALCEGLPHDYSEAKSSEGRNRHATHTQAKHRAGEGTGLKTPRGAVAGRKQHPAPLLSGPQFAQSGAGSGHGVRRLRRQQSQSRAGVTVTREGGREARELPASERASAAHAGVGRELGSKQALVGHCRLQAGGAW